MSCLHESAPCPVCHDRLIHQNNRGQDEAASGLLQWIHDNVPNTMDVVDDDLHPESFHIAKQKFRPPLWRPIEHKPVGIGLRPSQLFLIPRMAASVDSGIRNKVYHSASGVFVVWSDPPYEKATIAKVRPALPFSYGPTQDLGRFELIKFWQCIESDRW